MTENTTAKELLELIERRISENKLKDAVHKIKFMTARDVIKELLIPLKNHTTVISYFVLLKNLNLHLGLKIVPCESII